MFNYIRSSISRKAWYIEGALQWSHVKVQQSPLFFNALTDSGGSRLFEAISDTYWCIGFDIKFASNTHPDCYRGSNVLGSVLEPSVPLYNSHGSTQSYDVISPKYLATQ